MAQAAEPLGSCAAGRKGALLSGLKAQIMRLETSGFARSSSGSAEGALTLGCADVDDALPGGGLARGAIHEVLAAEHRDRPAALGFLLGLLTRLLEAAPAGDRRPLLWVQQEEGLIDFGTLYGPGLKRFGLDPARLIVVTARAVDDVLWALEEALKCRALLGVVGSFGRGSASLDLTALRRLQLRAEASGLPAFLLRLPSDQPCVVARSRWRIAARPSGAPAWARQAPFAARNHGIGNFSWQVALEKCRGGTPAIWQLEWTHAAHRFCLASPMADRPVLPVRGPEEGAEVFPLHGGQGARVA